MPLPAPGTPWPPKPLAEITPWLDRWSAWLAGDVDGLNRAYQHRPPIDRPAQYRGGIQGTLARAFYGKPLGDRAQPRRQLHVPLAAAICQASADLLFAEPPTFTVEHTGTQDRIGVLVDDGLHTKLAEGAELGAALGGVFLRASWDPATVPGRPFLTTVDADAAWPEFRWGQLVAVTFWWVLSTDGNTVYRHVERHELDSNRDGLVLHGLYQGTPTDLGRPIPLTEHPSTAPLADEIGPDGAIVAGRTPGLCVEYVPNQTPQRRWRTHPLGRNYGRSDLDGIEPLMEALDASWTSWMRDLDLGRARVLVSKELLTSHGPGQGASFDTDAEIFTRLDTAPGSLNPDSKTGAARSYIEPVQFEIRVAEHSQTCAELTSQILRSAGYSAQTFGEVVQDSSITATEVHARQARSFTTRDRKIRAWRPALGRLLPKLLSVDAAIFGGTYDPEGLVVDFPDGVQEGAEAIARTAGLLRNAEAASTRTLVQLQHPDWDDTQVDAEVALILAETGRAVPDPIGDGEDAQNIA